VLDFCTSYEHSNGGWLIELVQLAEAALQDITIWTQ
jgi:hypothetical protein